MKLAGAAIVSIFALLFAGVVEGCPTLKATGKKYVVGGKSTYYKVRVSTGSAAVDNAALTITLPDGVKLDSYASSPKRSAPSQSGADLTWTGLSLAARKHYTFRVKVDVDACAPDELDFEANVSGGSCDVDAATVTTTVKRAKGSEPCPTGICLDEGEVVNGTPLYNCGNYFNCGSPVIFALARDACFSSCQASGGVLVTWRSDIKICNCNTGSADSSKAALRVEPSYVAYAMGKNPESLNIVLGC